MRKILSLFAVIGVLSVSSFSVSAQTSFTNVVKNVKPAVFKVTVYDKFNSPFALGTGFFIDSTGTAVSNAHVFEDAYGAEVLLANGKKLKVDYVIAQDIERDLVIFKVSNKDTNRFSYLSINDTILEEGDNVFVIGAPQGFEGTVSTGIISSIRKLEDFEQFGEVIQITAPISHGSSGSPVIRMDGRVIGVATLVYGYGQNLNFAVDARNIRKITHDTVWFQYDRVVKFDSTRIVYYPSGDGVLTKKFFVDECKQLSKNKNFRFGEVDEFCECFYEKLLANYSDNEISELITVQDVRYSIYEILYDERKFFSILRSTTEKLKWTDEARQNLIERCKLEMELQVRRDPEHSVKIDSYCPCMVDNITKYLLIEDLFTYDRFLFAYANRNHELMKELYEKRPKFKDAMEDCIRDSR